MRLAAIFAYVLFSALAASQTPRSRRQLSLGSQLGSQHVIGNSDTGHRRRPQSPIPLGQPTNPELLTGFVAFGDSYSAGIGTGFKNKEDDCRHGLGAHAVLIMADLKASQGGRDSTAFQFLSCTGATTTQILSGGDESQIDTFDISVPADFALLSIGGNDLGFFDVMNACVFRFYNFYSGTCDSALANARAQLEGGEFEQRLYILIMEILDKVRWEKKPWFFITVTGYARFFNDVTDDCDGRSFGIWWQGPKLKKELRLGMNALILTVNAKIRKTVDSINSKFTKDKLVFVDYDDEFDGHRFCEEGVVEPDYERQDSWFFLVGGPDNARNSTQPKRVSRLETLSSDSALVDPSSCLAPAQRSGDWGELALCYMAMSKHEDPSLQFAREDAVGESSMWWVPTYYGKTFHPKSLGHEAIKKRIYEVWRTLE